MWTANTEVLAKGRTTRSRLLEDGQPSSFVRVLEALQDDADFRLYFNGLLADSPYSAFRWETPGATITTADRPFEFVLLDAPELDREPNASVFANQLATANDRALAIEFSNLGGDATLIVPRPLARSDAYCHLADFTRNAPESQIHSLWALVATAMQRRLNERPAWLSTAGAGVAWLHVRIDDRPKYYGFAPYRQSSL